jgi:putative PEP-CTERM system histidine kinase
MDDILEIMAAVACFALLANVCYAERRHTYARDALALGLLLFGAECLLGALAARATLLPEALFWLRWRLLVMALLPGCWLLFSATYARGDAAVLVRRDRALLLALGVLPTGLVLFFWSSLLQEAHPPTARHQGWLTLGPSGVALHMLLIVGSVLCLMNLERTLRTSIGTMRWRIKYMIVGLGMVLIMRCYSSSQALLYSLIDLRLTTWDALALLPGCALMHLAVRRGSLHAVDLYPSHDVLYRSLILMLAAAYLLCVGLFAEIATYLGVATWFPLQAFILLVSLLGVATILLSNRLRQQLRQFITHHFRRGAYDYRHIWSLFSEQTGTATDPPAFCRAASRLIADTLETLSVSIWLLAEDGQRLTLGGSSALSETQARQQVSTDRYLDDTARRQLCAQTAPVPVRTMAGELGAVVRQLGQPEFKQGGEYFCLALAARDELCGLLVLGDRIGGAAFTSEELELLKTIGHHVTAHLQRLRLARHLADAKKLEAFQTMSAFFVHDLKNTAATLALMLQNLPRHFDDPAFRRDAFQAIAHSTEKLNSLITRLSQFRQDLELHPHPTDLPDLARQVVAGWHTSHPATVTLALAAVPPVMVDDEQLQKVIINLLANARESSSPDAPIQLRTALRDGWVCLEVLDHGCGMSAAFMAQALFQPFQTTKPQGIGIGLFQSKLIVEAHGGRLQVQSQPGSGSTFCICLPTQEEHT